MRVNFIIVLLTFLPLPFLTSWRIGEECSTQIKIRIPDSTFVPFLENEEYIDEREQGIQNMSVFDTMASVHEALASCPNITDLDIHVYLAGCSEGPDR